MDSNIPADLLELKARFQAWRQTRKFNRSRTPDDLRQAALEILKKYPARLVCRVCRIHPKTLRKSTDSPAAAHQRKSKVSFFKLPLVPVSETGSTLQPAGSGCRIQLERPDGSPLTLLTPSLDATSLNSLCRDFLRSS
jgi:hypothetical protein